MNLCSLYYTHARKHTNKILYDERKCCKNISLGYVSLCRGESPLLQIPCDMYKSQILIDLS